MIHSMKSEGERFELRRLELLPDQSLVPEEIRNLAQGVFFILQFYCTAEFEYPHRTLEIFRDALECNFHVQLSKLYTEDEDSLLGKLRANFSKEDIPDEVQNTMTNIIVDFTQQSMTSTQLCSAAYKVETILVNIGVVSEVSMQDGLFRSVLLTLKIEECSSLMEERCAICLEEFSGEGDISLMPCSHAYHKDCIADWLKLSLHCPTCRFNLCPPSLP